MQHKTAIVWFRQDLRLSDNPSLLSAHKENDQILPLFILDDDSAEQWAMGAASRWWLHHSLTSLNSSLNGNLCLRTGNALDALETLIEQHNISAVYWNRCYEPWRIKRDSAIKAKLKSQGLEVKSYNGSLLFEPHTTLKRDGTPYKVFTPFYKKGCLAKNPEPALPEPKPKSLEFAASKATLEINALNLLPERNWYKDIEKNWTPGEDSAQDLLSRFLNDGLNNYKEGRNFPSKANISRLSPHLHFGEISPRSVWHAAKHQIMEKNWDADGETFLSELGWREFSHNLLFYFPELPHKNLQEKFDSFPWRDDDIALSRWQSGQTGYPIVDAGMRELWQTGYMHNRVRMIVGSFLVKNLLLDWRKGEAWFWDTLVDADLANNAASWQWIGGCGADAAPYFRIFNPVTQGQKFDKDGVYVRRFVPELARLPNKYIHNPWEAPEHILNECGFTLGEDYPEPIVDLKASRERALSAFKSISGK